MQRIAQEKASNRKRAREIKRERELQPFIFCQIRHVKRGVYEIDIFKTVKK